VRESTSQTQADLLDEREVTVEEELVNLEASNADELSADSIEDDLIAGKQKGDEDGIIAVLIG
jgi:hypothetical protein